MTNNASTFTSFPPYSYQQHFQKAVRNFEDLVREERLLKRIQKSKTKIVKA